MNELLSLTPAQLHRAADIKEMIVKLESELASIGSSRPAITKSKFGPAARERIAAAQKKRWAKSKAVRAVVEPSSKKRRKMSAASRARIAAAAKARWAKAKATGKNSL